MQSGRDDTLEERYAIKFCFKLGKIPQKHMECFRLLLEHLAWIEHQFLSGVRGSGKSGSLWGMMRSMGGVRKSIHQTWLKVPTRKKSGNLFNDPRSMKRWHLILEYVEWFSGMYVFAFCCAHLLSLFNCISLISNSPDQTISLESKAMR